MLMRWFRRTVPKDDLSPTETGTQSADMTEWLLLLKNTVGRWKTTQNTYLKQLLLATFCKRNTQGFTGLHLAAMTGDSELIFDLVRLGMDPSVTDNEGKNALHHACSVKGENQQSLVIVEELLQTCQLNEEDIEGKTPLHWAVHQGLQMTTKMLLEKKGIMVHKLDKSGRSPLHYAAHNGCQRGGFVLVEALMDYQFEDEDHRLKFLFKDEDSSGETIFSLVCRNCPAKTVELFLRTTSNPENWLNDEQLALIYYNQPLSLKILMDQSFAKDKEPSQFEHPVIVDYGPVTGYSDKRSQPQPETTLLLHSRHWTVETKKKIFGHPLVKLFLLKKAQQLQPFTWLCMIWEILWLASFTILDESAEKNRDQSESSLILIASTYMMITYISASFISIVVRMFWLKKTLSHSTISLQIVLAFISFVHMSGIMEPLKWHKYFVTLVEMLVYTIGLRKLSSLFFQWGVRVRQLEILILAICQALLMSSPILIGFGRAFVRIFDEVSLLLYIVFVLLIQIAFYKLLSGVVLGNELKLKDEVEVECLAKQVESFYQLEEWILLLQHFNGVACRWTWIMDVNVSKMDNEAMFETIFKEKIRRPQTNHVEEKRGGSSLFLCCGGTGTEAYDWGMTEELVEKIDALVATRDRE